MSRREFVAGSLASAALHAIERPAFGQEAAGGGSDPHRFALLADTHVAADTGTVVRGANMAEHLRSVTADVLATRPLPSQAVVAGDLALASGEAGDYATLIRLLEPLVARDMPVHLALGNHDHLGRFRDAFAAGDGKRAAAIVEAKHVAVVESPRADWYVLDSPDKTDGVPGLSGSDNSGGSPRRSTRGGNGRRWSSCITTPTRTRRRTNPTRWGCWTPRP